MTNEGGPAMKLTRLFLALALVGALAGVAYVAQQVEPSGMRMAHAATRFLDTLTPEQKAKATFGFDDKLGMDKERPFC